MILLLLSLSALGVIHTHGQCNFSPLKTDVTALGTQRKYCEYQEKVGASVGSVKVGTSARSVKVGASVGGVKVLQGASFKTLDCHTCICNQYGLRCCPTNRDPRSLYVPPHCRVILDGCVPTPVRKSDNKTDCYSARPVQIARQDRQRMNRVINNFEKMDRYRRQQIQRSGETPEAPTIDEMLIMMSMSGALDNSVLGPVGNRPPFSPIRGMSGPSPNALSGQSLGRTSSQSANSLFSSLGRTNRSPFDQSQMNDVLPFLFMGLMGQ